MFNPPKPARFVFSIKNSLTSKRSTFLFTNVFTIFFPAMMFTSEVVLQLVVVSILVLQENLQIHSVVILWSCSTSCPWHEASLDLPSVSSDV